MSSVDASKNSSISASPSVVKVPCNQYTRLQKLRKYTTNTVNILAAFGLLHTSGKRVFGSLKPKYSVQRRALEALLCMSTALHHLTSSVYAQCESEIAGKEPAPSTELSNTTSKTTHLTAMDKINKIVQFISRYSPIGSALMCGYIAYMLPELKSDMSPEYANCDAAFAITRVGFLGLGAYLVKNFYQAGKCVKTKEQVVTPNANSEIKPGH